MNNELIERIDGAYFGFCSEKTETLIMDCKAEIERLTLANETLSALNVEYLKRVKLLEAEAWRESKAIEAKPVGEAIVWQVRIHYDKNTVTHGWSEWGNVNPTQTETVEQRVKNYQDIIDGGYKDYQLRQLYTAPPSIDALIDEIKKLYSYSLTPNMVSYKKEQLEAIFEKHKGAK